MSSIQDNSRHTMPSNDAAASLMLLYWIWGIIQTDTKLFFVPKSKAALRFPAPIDWIY